jgi:hypothetical protein
MIKTYEFNSDDDDNFIQGGGMNYSEDSPFDNTNITIKPN